MEQSTVRRYVERYMSAFGAHVMESHPDYLSITLPVDVDKDIGNRPFYWTWVEKMNLPYQPLTITFHFNGQPLPQGMRGEVLHFGSARLSQIFASARKHGQFVCLYEQTPMSAIPLRGGKRSVPLTPWLCLNVKISFICDKKRDMLAYFGVNLHQPRLVHDFYPFLKQLSLHPAIPDYHFTLERRLSLDEAIVIVKRETDQLIAAQDQSWAEQARERLQEEISILEAFYEECREREPAKDADSDDENSVSDESLEGEQTASVETAPVESLQPSAGAPMRILDFLRMNGIQETPKQQIAQEDWKSSTLAEEKERRIAELKWQYEPRIELSFMNGGIFYLHNQPPFSG
ncbi:MAG: YqhG family protein [Clostridia bacterium]